MFSEDSCLNLTLSVPETYIVTGVYHSSDTSDYYEFGELSVVFNNIVYCDSEVRLGKTSSQDDEYIFHETTLFGNYDTSSFRNMSELRLDITIHTPDDHLSQYEELDACVAFTNNNGDRLYPFYFYTVFDGYMSNNTYRTIQCIPSDKCVEFVADDDDEWPKSFEYTILVNGEEQKSAGWMINTVIPYMLRLLLEAKAVQIKGFQVASLIVL
jgi:hypothetical protein